MAVYICAGTAVGLINLAQADARHLSDFLYYLLCAIIAALGLKLTTHRNAIPAGFLVMLLAIQDLSLPELLFIASVVSLLGQLQEAGNTLPRPTTLVFSLASGTIGIAAAQTVHQAFSVLKYNALFPAPVIASSLVLLLNWGLGRTLSKDSAVSLSDVLRKECRPLLPWFVGVAYLAYLIRSAAILNGLNAGLVTLPMLFALDAAFRAWFNSKAKHREELAALQKRGLEKLAALHQRTLETLAVAIDGRDHTTHMHLRRVQFYVRAVGEELKLSEEQLEHLNVAALLHDIGKLGIPDHILLKPGPLSPEEWEKMKTHPLSGAEMLSRMNFPDPVLQIVATHHEKWDGTGYPRGLKAEQIPIGARILSAVDCLDALASDRPYRGALPIDMAMARVSKEEGRSFDPLVVSVLQRRYVELERTAWGEVMNRGKADGADAQSKDLGKLSTTLNAESRTGANSILDPIVSARQETQLLQTLANALTHSLGGSEVTSAIHERVKQMIAHDTLAIYVSRGDELEPIEIVGENSHLFGRDAFPIEKGLSGRVIQHGTSIMNGDPCMEFGYKNDSVVVYKLQSALAVPLIGPKGMAGVLTLYHTDRHAFNRDHLRLLEAVSQQVAPAVESALRYHDTEKLAVTDHLTGVPNARSLELHLHRELSRAQRDNTSVGVLVCDLNGFKQVNDRFGHLKGNEVLQAVARGLQEVCRKSDYVARMGGDEFVIVVPGLREELRWSYVERLQNVAHVAGWNVCSEQCISMSVGTAIYPFDGADAEVLLAEADRRMYTVKQQTSSLAMASSNRGEPVVEQSAS
ncbi:MAG: diguanylate cyclase and metal dependent phosphohydrolase [Bryobacterales bacterium]|nr:diguanylate cyclase and metal dependent phosphohydrolase [Bryobacterales bacterium]